MNTGKKNDETGERERENKKKCRTLSEHIVMGNGCNYNQMPRVCCTYTVYIYIAN